MMVRIGFNKFALCTTRGIIVFHRYLGYLAMEQLANGAHLIAASEWIKREGLRKTRVVLAMRGFNDYVTWSEYDAEDGQPPYTADGVYFDRIDKAAKNFYARAKLLLVRGGSIVWDVVCDVGI